MDGKRPDKRVVPDQQKSFSASFTGGEAEL